MTTRRETDLKRLSRIDSIRADDEDTATDSAAQQRGHPVAIMTIEAAIAIFLSGIYDTIDWCFVQGGFIKSSNNAITKQSSQELTEKIAKALESDESARYQYRVYKRFYEPAPTVFDRLDAGRETGFLLYSYNKYGTHSTLGGQAAVTSGAYFLSEA